MRRRLIFRILGYLFCILPALYAIFEHFPLFAEEGAAPTLSGFAFLLVLLALIPFHKGILRQVRRWLASPSAYSVWLVLWLVFEWLGRISTAIADISLVAFIGSLIGAVFFRLGKEQEDERA